MTSRDNFNSFESCLMTVPATKTSTVTSSPVDVSTFNSVTICFIFGASGDTLSGTVYWTCKITECDTYNGIFTDVTDAETINGTTPSNSIVVDASGEASKAYKLGYTGNAKYLKGVVTATGTHTYGTPIAIMAVLGNERMGPGQQASLAVATS
ncbi:hypothetical protein AMJ86_01125 [bacterium SM23_57]|nr:MAG: hypothetical protein AMJ86_01125 [bacterium SM23_57]